MSYTLDFSNQQRTLVARLRDMVKDKLIERTDLWRKSTAHRV